MDTTRLLVRRQDAMARHRRAIENAKAQCETAGRLRRLAVKMRGEIHTSVRQDPRPLAIRGLAHGGSDDPPPGRAGLPFSKLEPRETTERRCPYCKEVDRVKPLGLVQIQQGVVRSQYHCATCDRAFVFVRRALG